MIAAPSEARRGLGGRFNLLWAGQAISQLGDYVAYVSIPLFVRFLTGGSIELAISYSLETAPVFMVGLAGGVLIDRMRLRPVMIFTDLARAAAFVFLAVVATDPAPDPRTALAAVFAVAFIAGTMAAVFVGALTTIVTCIVSPIKLASANARIATTEQLATIAGPALAGVLISQGGFAPTFMINASTFVVSAISLVILGPVDRARARLPRARFWEEAMIGLRHLWNERRLRVGTLAVAAAHLVLGFIEATFVLAAERIIGATEAWQQGTLFAVFGAGAVVGAILSPGVARVVGLGRSMVIGLVVLAGGYLAFVHTPFGVVGSSYLFIAFFGFQLLNVPYITIRQVYTPAEMLGRVATAARAVAWATLPIGALAGAIISERTGSFVAVTRFSPLFLLVVGVSLIATVIWRDTFGPTWRRGRPTSGEPVTDEALHG